MNILTARNLASALAHPFMVIKGIPATIKIASNSSYYPEKKRKGYMHRVFDNMGWLIKNGHPNYYYTQYGLDIAGTKSTKYVDKYVFARKRGDGNKIHFAESQTCILRDKFLFYKYLKSNNMPLPEIFAIIFDGKTMDVLFNQINIDNLNNREKFFLKDAGGECASFVKRIKNFDELKNIYPQLKKGRYILQETITQCDEMNKMNPNSVNTLRIVTKLKDGEPVLFSSLLRVGTAATGNVDNTSAGGIAIGINEDGHLKEYGFYKPEFGRKITSHPDSGIVFKEFQVPMYKEAVNLALRAHRQLYDIDSIGWDIAITKNGPVFIEGNDNWEITSIQACNGPINI